MTKRLLTKIGYFEENAGEGTVRVFNFRATPADEAGLGKLFAMGEAQGAAGDRALKTIEAILNEYYNPASRSRWAKGRSLGTETLFEELLHEVNDEWARLRPLPEDLIHVIVGLQKDNHLHLGSRGSMRALLFRDRGDNYLQHFDLLRLREGTDSGQTAFFSHVISGELLAGDSVVLLSRKFLDALTLREVERTLSLNPQAGAAILQEEALRSNKKESLGAMLLKRVTEDDGGVRMHPIVQPHRSVDELVKTERSTELVLAPRNFPAVREFLASITLRDGKTRHRRNALPRRRNRLFYRLLKKIIMVIAAITNGVYSIFKFIFKLTTNFHGERQKVLDEVKQTGQGTLLKGVTSFNILPRRSKTILFVGLSLLFIFTQSAIFVARRENSRERERAWRAIYDDIAGTRDEIESSLLYNDEERARTLLSEALQNINLLQKDNRKHEEQIKNLESLLEQTALRVRRIITVPNPTILFSMSSEAAPWGLTLYGGNLLAWSSRGEVFSISRETQNVTQLPSAAINTGNIIITSEDSDLIAISPEQMAFYNADTWTIKQLEKKERAALEDAVLYGGRLYLLDPAKDAIWKYNKTEAGFAGETPWLREPYELQSINSFTIDNSLYLLDNRGTIRKFYRGREQEFKVTPLEPSFGAAGTLASAEEITATRPGKIRTTGGSPYLYIVDPSGKRLVIYKKDGKLAAQYSSPKFDDLRDVAFDEARKEIYLLNGNTIYALLSAHQQ